MKPIEAFDLETFQDQFSTLILTPLTEKAGYLVPNKVKFRNDLAQMKRDDSLSLQGIETYNRNFWYKLFGNLQSTLPLVSHYMGLWHFNKFALRWFSKECYLNRDLGEVPVGFFSEVRNEINGSNDAYKKLLLNQALSLDLAWYELFRVPFRDSTSDISIPNETSVFHLKDNIRILFDSFGLWEQRFQINEHLESSKSSEDAKTINLQSKKQTIQCMIMKSQNLTVESLEVPLLHGQFLEKLNHQTLANGIDRFSQTLKPDQLKTAETSIHNWIRHSLELGLWYFENETILEKN